MSDFNLVEGDVRVESGDKGISVGAPLTSNPVDANTEALHVDASKTTVPISNANLNAPLSGLATEAKLEAVRALLAAIDADMDVALSTRASEATVATLATEAKLEAVRALLFTIDQDTSNLDVALSTRATEVTLEAARLLLLSLDGKDFATETTLSTRATEATAAAIQSAIEAIRDTAGIKKITDPLPAGTNVIGKATISEGGNDASVNGDNRLLVEAELASGGAVQSVKITDGTESFIADVTADGRLKVEQTTPIAPPGFTEVSDFEVGTISAPNFKNYIIPVGETLIIQQFIAGCEGEGGKGARVVLFYDQGGGEPIQNLEIARLYVQASSAIFPLEFTAPRPAQAGDRIRIQRTPLEGSTQEVYGYWKGYY